MRSSRDCVKLRLPLSLEPGATPRVIRSPPRFNLGKRGCRDGEIEMSDDMNEEVEYFADFQDVVAQRTIAFCRLAQITGAAQDERIRELCLTMMRKVCASVRTPASGEVRLISEVDTDSSVGR